MSGDEVAHHGTTSCIVENDHSDAVLTEQILRSVKISILADNYPRDTVKQRRPGAHDARAESADQRQLRPVAASARVANANCLRMGRGVASLNAKVMAAGDNAPLAVRQN